jgi:hypothetical protein
MAGNISHLAQLEDWYIQWLEPAHYQIYRGETAAALETLCLAEQQLERETGMSADERQVLRYEIAWSPFNFLSFIGEYDELEVVFHKAMSIISEPPPGPVSAPTQAFYRLSLAAKGVTFGYIQPDPHEMRALIDQIPRDRLVIGAWVHVATVAFYMGCPQMVEEAFGELLTGTTGLRDGYTWLRVNLMYLLSQGRAQAEDFRQLLASIQHIGELLSFKRDFLTHAERLGILPQVEALAGPLEDRLRSNLQPPEREPTTRRVLRRSN